jgi:hypothetical protein
MLVHEVRDSTLDFLEGIFENRYEAPHSVRLQTMFENATEEDKDRLQFLVKELVDGSIQGLSVALENDRTLFGKRVYHPELDREKPLSGNYYGTLGWCSRYSKYPWRDD